MKCIKPDCFYESLLGSLSCAECREKDYISSATFESLGNDLLQGKIYPILYCKAVEYIKEGEISC